MPSSKIDATDLDPNMGLAKESTSQEILSELRNKADAVRVLKVNNQSVSIAASEAAKTVTAVDISGSGELQFACLSCGSLDRSIIDYMGIKVTVDDKVIFDLTVTDTASNSKATVIGLLNPDYIYHTPSYNYVMGTSKKLSDNQITAYNLSASAQSTQVSSAYNHFALIPDGIKFNRNLKIEVSHAKNDQSSTTTALSLSTGYYQ